MRPTDPDLDAGTGASDHPRPLPPVDRPFVDRPYGPIPGDPDYVPITPPPNTRMPRWHFIAAAIGIVVLFVVVVKAFGG